ncbi:MAG: type II toxin-antitoxin system HicB family antitoxin [Bacillota bacterium]|nr:type II toxin-antitoxin system HicB family antitoxin [Bacillota bacterium]
MMKYVYPAIFKPEDNGMYSVIFPDIEGCYTCGNDLAHAIFMAEDVLACALCHYEDTGRSIPAHSSPEAIEIEKNDFVNYVYCDITEYRKKHSNRAVKKTLSIPEWLNEAAIAKGLNFSQVLQDGLKSALKID